VLPFYGSILKCFALAALWIIIVKITFFSLVVVFYALSVWHFLLVYFEFISLSVKYSLVKCFNSPFLIDDLRDCISQSDLCLLPAVWRHVLFCHNLTSTEIHLCITFQVYTFFHRPSSQGSVLSLFHVSLLGSLFYHFPAVIIVGPQSTTHPFAVMLAPAFLRRTSQSSLSLE